MSDAPARSLPSAPTGVLDWLPPEAAAYDLVEDAFLRTAKMAGYQRIRVPVFEHTEVFARAVGESTDVVQKEMYTFDDKGGRSLTLRPELTAGVVRAALQAGVPRAGGLPAKYLYAGECFRYERPQSGRYRQFGQVDLEALGSDDPALDAEVVLLGWDALRAAGLADVTLRLNSLGDRADRAAYHERLNAYLDSVDDLPADVAQRRHLNPLRAFDSKAPGMAEIMASAPLLWDSLSDAARDYHAAVVGLLEGEGVPITADPRLVRGLDYYSRTTFEFHATNLGAQTAVGGGGRYDGLAEDLGYPERFPGIGWALGIDRTVMALRGAAPVPLPARVAAFVVVAGGLDAEGFSLVTALRRSGVAADMAFGGRSTKAQFKVADRSGARVALVIGPAELERGVVGLRDLRAGEQREVARDAVVGAVRDLLAAG